MEVTLTIRMTPQGVRVEGPLEQRVMLYGMLEAARDVIRDYTPQPIEIAGPGLTRQLVPQRNGV